MPLSTPHLYMSDSTTQAIASAGTPQLVTFDTTEMASKIAATSSSRFTVNEAGMYRAMIDAHVTAGAANKVYDLWARVNGTDVVRSNSKTLVVNNEIKMISMAFIVTLTAGQYIELWVNGDDTSLALIAYAAGVTPTRPATPSIRFTLEREP